MPLCYRRRMCLEITLKKFLFFTEVFTARPCEVRSNLCKGQAAMQAVMYSSEVASYLARTGWIKCMTSPSAHTFSSTPL
jgi:hypothetical protein